MSVIETTLEVDAPPGQVWEVVSDPRNLPLWDRHVVAVRGVPPTGLRKGTSYLSDVRFVGVRTTVSAKVLELRPPRYAKVRLDGLLDATVETWVEPLTGGRSRLRHRVDYRFRGGPLGRLAARTVRMLGASAVLRRGTQAQKRQIELG
jgi:carbon monoxide dehydrogenase subunit G